MADDSKILSELEVDDAIELDANYRFGEHDRRYMDNQILGCEQHLVDCVIGGMACTYARIDSSSPSINPGDVVCLSGLSLTVTKALPTPLGSAGSAFGVAIRAAAPGSKALFARGGAIPTSITSLSAASGFARVSSSGRVEYVSVLSSGDASLGTIASDGSLNLLLGFGGVGGTSSSGALVVDVMANYQDSDGAPTRNGHTTKEIGFAIERSYNAALAVARPKHMTLKIPPADQHGVDGYTWDHPVTINTQTDKQWTIEIVGSGQASKIIPGHTALDDKLTISAGGPETQPGIVIYRDMFWVGDKSTTSDCASLLKTSADLTVVVEDCLFYGILANGSSGFLQVDSDNLTMRRVFLNGCGNTDATKARISVDSGFWGMLFEQVQSTGSEHATDPFGDSTFEKSSSYPCYDVWLKGDDPSHPPVAAKFSQCIFGGTSSSGAVLADPTSGYIESVHFDQCVVRDSCYRTIKATANVGRVILDGCILSHNDGAVPSIALEASTCKRLIVKRTHATHSGIVVNANTGQRSITIEDSDGGTWDCSGAGSITIDESSSFDAFTGTATGFRRPYKVSGSSVGGAAVVLKDFDGNDIALTDGKSYLIRLEFSGGRTDTAGNTGAAIRTLAVHTSGGAITIDTDTLIFNGLPVGWSLVAGSSGLSLTTTFTADAGTVEGYCHAIVQEVDSKTSGFSLASLSWDGLWYDFADAGGGAPVLPVPGHASAGTSGTQNLVTDAADPVIGTALNGKGILSFDGTMKLKTVGDLAAFTNVNSWSGVFVFKPSSTQTGNPTTPYSDPCLFVNGDGIWGFSSTDQGARAWKYDGVGGAGGYNIDVAGASATATQWAYLFAYFDGTKIYTRLLKSGTDSGWSAGTTAGNTDWGGEATTFVNWIGAHNDGTPATQMDLALAGVSKTTFSTTDFTNIKGALNALFGLSF